MNQLTGHIQIRSRRNLKNIADSVALDVEKKIDDAVGNILQKVEDSECTGTAQVLVMRTNNHFYLLHETYLKREAFVAVHFANTDLDAGPDGQVVGGVSEFEDNGTFDLRWLWGDNPACSRTQFLLVNSTGSLVIGNTMPRVTLDREQARTASFALGGIDRVFASEPLTGEQVDELLASVEM